MALKRKTASCRDGCTEAIMLAHGFPVEQLAKLAGLATASVESIAMGTVLGRAGAGADHRPPTECDPAGPIGGRSAGKEPRLV
jgi:hypothetical protein